MDKSIRQELKANEARWELKLPPLNESEFTLGIGPKASRGKA
jgi:hypothetical protein